MEEKKPVERQEGDAAEEEKKEVKNAWGCSLDFVAFIIFYTLIVIIVRILTSI